MNRRLPLLRWSTLTLNKMVLSLSSLAPLSLLLRLPFSLLSLPSSALFWSLPSVGAIVTLPSVNFTVKRPEVAQNTTVNPELVFIIVVVYYYYYYYYFEYDYPYWLLPFFSGRSTQQNFGCRCYGWRCKTEWQRGSRCCKSCTAGKRL